MPYLTPDSAPDSADCRALFIPNTLDWLAIVTGALQELTFAYNWEKFGAVTPQEAADRAFTMLNDFIDNGGCNSSSRMIGEIIPYAGSASPQPTLLMCDGQSLLRADYPDLFAAIGTLYGSVDSSHFNIPDLRGRTLIHQGGGYTIATPVGEATHTLTTAEMPAHSHTSPAYPLYSVGNYLTTNLANGGVTNVATSSAGSGEAHNNVQPSMPISYLIVAKAA